MNSIPEESMTGGEVEEAKEVKRKSLHVEIKEKSWFGKKCVKVFRVFSNTFAVTFLAEWGDRCQIATIVMAGIYDVGGVCVGGVQGISFALALHVVLFSLTEFLPFKIL